MEYKIFQTNQQIGTWKVYSGHTSHGDWIKDDLEYSSNSIADCYAWIKAKQENLLA
jgi:hypothetical protein